MRKLLWLALLLYDVVCASRQGNYNDYDDMASDLAKRHSMLEEKRGWRRKAFAKPDMEVREWEERRRAEYDPGRYPDDMDKSYVQERAREREPETSYRRRYEDLDKLNMALGGGPKSAEISHPKYPEMQHGAGEPEKQKQPLPLVLNCDRPHERYEACFAGCASVSCDNPRDRLKPCYPFCEPGCVCVPPYVRDDRTHKCVLPDDCTKGLKGIPDLGEEA